MNIQNVVVGAAGAAVGYMYGPSLLPAVSPLILGAGVGIVSYMFIAPRLPSITSY